MECTLAFPSCMNLEIFLCHWICECDVSCNYGWKHLLPDFKAWPPSLPPCASVQCPAQPPWVPPAVPQGQGHQCHHAVIALVTPSPSNRDNDNKTVPHWWHHCALEPSCHSMQQEQCDVMSMTATCPGLYHYCSMTTMTQMMKWPCHHCMMTTCPRSCHHHNTTATMEMMATFWSCPPLHLQVGPPPYLQCDIMTTTTTTL